MTAKKLNLGVEKERLKGNYCPKKDGCCWNFFGRKKPTEKLI